MVVVDTNVLAYLLIAGDHTPAARALYERDLDWRSEAFIFTEFANILTTSVRTSRLTLARAEALLSQAETCVAQRVVAIHADVLRLAIAFGVSAYDARFLAAAHSLGARLVTQDQRLRAAAPALTLSLDQALAAS